MAWPLPYSWVNRDTSREYIEDEHRDRETEDTMKRAFVLGIGLLVVLAVATTASAQTQTTQATQKRAGTAIGPDFIDGDGDGICDNLQVGTRAGKGGQKAGRGGYGPGDGTGNQGMGPKNGTGFGPGGGSGLCDGTGPKGNGARRGPRR